MVESDVPRVTSVLLQNQLNKCLARLCCHCPCLCFCVLVLGVTLTGWELGKNRNIRRDKIRKQSNTKSYSKAKTRTRWLPNGHYQPLPGRVNISSSKILPRKRKMERKIPKSYGSQRYQELIKTADQCINGQRYKDT